MRLYLQSLRILKSRHNGEHKFIRSASGLGLWKEELSGELKHRIEEYWSPRLTYNPFNVNDTQEKYYVLSMFPYPSGHLHMGHVRVYTISDSIARYQRMNGKNVIHPIGWDAFGLPAENAAIERNIAPKEWTKQNIAHMKVQLQQLGCSFEWEREISTCNPRYYRWTQDLFLKLYKAGLAYQKEAFVNWDPIDNTVLANEQVDENGRSWRSGAKVEQKLLKQWFIKTTRFAKALYDGLDDPLLQDWRDIIKIQKHWIGECNGVSLNFPLSDNGNYNNFITLWTASPQYLNDAKFIAVSKQHLLGNSEGVYIIPGIKRLHISAKNPLNDQELPIFVTDQIEFLESTDIHLGIPGINENDELFCQKIEMSFSSIKMLDENEVKEKQKFVCEKLGGYWTSAKLSDWLISRQRYWGTPIPIIHCKACGVQPVAEENLPVELPDIIKVSDKRISHLSELTEWVNTTCPRCNGFAKREVDTMDTFVDSSWYYLRYINPGIKEMFDIKAANTIMPVDLYIGGKEHATLHLYYARFVSHFLHSLGLLPEKEPFKILLVHGIVMGRSYRIKGTGQYIQENDVKIVDAKRNKAIHVESEQPVVISWEKMSKSKRNGVDPTEMFNEYGVDTTRLLILADVAPTSHRNWNSNTFPGIINWQKRLWLTITEFINHRQNLPALTQDEELKKHDEYIFDSRNYYVKGVNFNYTTAYQLSVAISKMQGLTNSLRKVPPIVFANSRQFERALACLLIMLAPMAPHFASELWSGFVSAPNRLNVLDNEIQWDKSILEQTWPNVDFDYNLDLVCLINGVESAIVKIPRHKIEKLSKAEVFNIALQQAPIQDLLQTLTVVNYSYTMFEGYEGVINIHIPGASSKKAAVQ